MPPTPIVFKTTHRIRFSDLDLYNHMTTGQYGTYYVDHRMEGLRDRIGWDLKTLGTLPFMTWVRRMEIDFVRPARGDQQIARTGPVSRGCAAGSRRRPHAISSIAQVRHAATRAPRCMPGVLIRVISIVAISSRPLIRLASSSNTPAG